MLKIFYKLSKNLSENSSNNGYRFQYPGSNTQLPSASRRLGSLSQHHCEGCMRTRMSTARLTRTQMLICLSRSKASAKGSSPQGLCGACGVYLLRYLAPPPPPFCPLKQILSVVQNGLKYALVFLFQLLMWFSMHKSLASNSKPPKKLYT